MNDINFTNNFIDQNFLDEIKKICKVSFPAIMEFNFKYVTQEEIDRNKIQHQNNKQSVTFQIGRTKIHSDLNCFLHLNCCGNLSIHQFFWRDIRIDMAYKSGLTKNVFCATLSHEIGHYLDFQKNHNSNLSSFMKDNSPSWIIKIEETAWEYGEQISTLFSKFVDSDFSYDFMKVKEFCLNTYREVYQVKQYRFFK